MRRAITVIFLLLLSALVMAAMVWLLWRPQIVLWAQNAYGMTRAGAWDGWQGLGAFLAYWFFMLKGRTLVTVMALCAWSLAVWRVVAWYVDQREEK